MVSREAYVAKMKAQLDKWNTQVAIWDSSARSASAGARKELEKQVGILRSRLDDAIFRLELVQGASANAWQDIKRGADEARRNMEQALQTARSQFKDI